MARTIPREIGRALNVAYVLTGQRARQGASIRLNAELIDVRKNARVWAEEYDRDSSDLFTLQGEIAQKIADKLGVGVSPAEKTASQEAATADLISYDAYLRAKDLLSDIALSTRQKGRSVPGRTQLLDQAGGARPVFL